MKNGISQNAGSARAWSACLLVALMAAPAASGEKLTAADRDAIVEKLAIGIEEGYVLEKKGRALAAQLRQMAAAGRFIEDDSEALAELLSRTLREISDDLHMRVASGGIAGAVGGPQRRMVRIPDTAAGKPPAGEVTGIPAEGGHKIVRVPAPASETSPGSPGRVRRAARADGMAELFSEMSARYPDNYRSEILPGNVGRLEIDILFPPHDRLEAALRGLADTDALILDLRSCPGGTGQTVRPLESAFFAEPTLLLTMARRGEEPMRILSSDDTHGGVKYVGKPVYVLTSNGTGSACEELAWSLKYHEKAVVVGETTAGAGHAITGTLDLGHDLTATIPSMRPIHPRFEGGFEGVGVSPDVTIASRRAADEAHLMALAAILENAEGADLRRLESIYAATALEIGRREREFVDRGRSLRSYSASFEGGHRLFVKDGELHYSDGRRRVRLEPLDEPDRFELRFGMSRMILRVERDGDGEIRGLAISKSGNEDWKRFDRERLL
jgi:hypothetical protein